MNGYLPFPQMLPTSCPYLEGILLKKVSNNKTDHLVQQESITKWKIPRCSC